MQKLTHARIVARQVARSREPRVPVSVVLDNIRSLDNVGAIFRTADGAGVKKLWLCGITGFPPQGKIARTALGAEESVAWEYAKDVVDVVRAHKAQGFSVVLLEQVHASVVYDEFIPDAPVCLVIGNEVDGISDEVVKLADLALEIPMAGIKNSLNVAVAFGVAVFHVARACKRAGL